MGLFKKKEKKEGEIEEDTFQIKSTIDKKSVREELKKFKRTKVRAMTEEPTVYEAVKSREYKEFQFEEGQLKLIKTIFEKACAMSSRFFTIAPSPKAKLQMQSDLDYLWFAVTPSQVLGLGLFMMIGFMLITFILILSGTVCIPLSFFFAIVGLLIFVYLPKYLSSLASQKRKRSMGEMPMLVLYMVMYIRNNPVIEGAVRFAAHHLKGPIAFDFRKLMWDVEIRKYLTIEEALNHYTEVWSQWDKTFADSMKLIQGSIREPNNTRRLEMLESAVKSITEGTSERMQHYTQDLKMPLTVLHALGIVLPVMGLVMFPMIVMFMSDLVSSSSLFIVYDIIIAGMVLFFGVNMLQTRPATSTVIDAISNHPKMPKRGCHRFMIGNQETDVPMFWPSVALGLLVAAPGILYLLNPAPPEEYQFRFVLQTLSLIAGIGTGVIVYSWGISSQRMAVRQEIIELENELPNALYQIGNKLMSGGSLENAIRRGTTTQGKRIGELFDKIVTNMENMNLTFEQALFHPQFGAMKYYPSDMVVSIMKVMVESSKKGMQQVAFSMISVSAYLKKLHKIEEEVREILGETATSMEFQATFLAPAISGVVVGLGIMIMQIMIGLNQKVATLIEFDSGGVGGMPSGMGLSMFGSGFLQVPPTSPEIFQLIVGLYMLEACLMLTYFASGISHGKDKITLYKKLSRSVLVAIALYSAAIIGSSIVFGGLVTGMVF